MLEFSNLNFLAVFVTTLLTFGIGSVWYTALLGKVWQKETGVTDTQIQQGNMLKTFGGSFICFLLLNVFIAAFFQAMPPKDWIIGALTGFQIGFLVNLSTLIINYLYQYKSLKLWLIDGGYQVIIMTVAGAILAVWR